MSYGRPSIDLESYAGLYCGRSKILRLQHIARSEPSLELDGLRLAVAEAKRGKDTVLYKSLLIQLDGRGGDISIVDEQWVHDQDVWAVTELDKLRRELEEIKEQKSKEAVRTAHTDLGDFFHSRGKLQQARGEYLKSRDYCVIPAHTLEVCFRTIVVSIEAGDFSNVDNYHHLAEHALPDAAATGAVGSVAACVSTSISPGSPPKSADVTLALTRACAGLALLVRSRYADAAHRLLSVATDPSEERTAALQTHFGDPLSLEDVATLGALCALATFTRPELCRNVIEHQAFRGLLELVPDVRELITDFYSSRYTRCLDTLERLKPDLRLDLYVGKDDHVDRLYAMIRQKALVQYVSPFLTVDLLRMEKVFKTSGPKLEAELCSLIESGAIRARIDIQNRALYRKSEQTQRQALEEALEKGEEAFNDVEAMLLRMAMVKNGLMLPAPSLSRATSALGPRGGSINSIADSAFDRLGGAG